MIKKLSLISLFTLLPASYYYAQTTVYAYVKDTQGNPIERADVDLLQSDNDVIADKIGYFQFVDMQPGHYQISITKPGYETRVLQFDVNSDEKKKDLGVISLSRLSGTSDVGVIVVDESQTDDDGGSMQPTVGLLSSGKDIFQSTAAFELGAYWFRPRGVDNRYEDVLFNGVSMSKNDDGRIDFSNWGGLNDVTRYPQENADNLTPSEYAFGNLGGVVYYNTRASSYRKGTSLAYSFTNRSYRHRLMATYSSGLSKSGWAFTLSGSRRWADEGVIEGTYQDSYAYFGSLEKKFSDRFSINLTAFGAPTYRASNSPNTQEVYDLMGKNYNAYWGWQDGDKRSSRVRKTFEPIFQLQTYNKLGKTSNWNNTFSYQIGSDARSRLDWFNASDPNPTYYKNLPSYIYADEYAALAALTAGTPEYNTAQDGLNSLIDDWRSNHNMQIDWAGLYNQNRNIASQTYTIGTDSAGKPITIEGRRAAYSIVEDVNKDKTFNFASHFDTKLQNNWKLNLNFNYQNLSSDNFRRIKDLLGADFALNLNNFLSNNTGTSYPYNAAPYNVDDPNYIVKKGDRTQYSYIINKDLYSLNASTEIDLNHWNVMASVFGAYSEIQRDGKYRSPFYLNNSKGKSSTYSSFDAGIKARVTYKINGKNFIVYDGTFYRQAPTTNEIFINPRVNDYRTPGVENQIVNANDLSYILRSQIVKLRISGYYTTIKNTTEISRYYAEVSEDSDGDAMIAEALSGADKRYVGGELGIDVKVTPTLNAFGVASVGEYKYTNNPQVSSFDDENGFRQWGKANIKNYKIAGTPQKAFSGGLKYNSPKYWWVGASANYLMDQYLDFSALNKTSRLYINPITNDYYAAATPELIQAITAQRKFDDQFMLNANAGKSFLLGKYRIGVSVSVNNILNNRNYVTGGYEQGRAVNFTDALAEYNRTYAYFAPKLWYDRGRTYFANVYFRF